MPTSSHWTIDPARPGPLEGVQLFRGHSVNHPGAGGGRRANEARAKSASPTSSTPGALSVRSMSRLAAESLNQGAGAAYARTRRRTTEGRVVHRRPQLVSSTYDSGH